jgi:hypothetical protein
MNKQSIHIWIWWMRLARGVPTFMLYCYVIGCAALNLGGSVLVPSIGVRRLYKDLVLLSLGGCLGRPFDLFPLPF